MIKRIIKEEEFFNQLNKHGFTYISGEWQSIKNYICVADEEGYRYNIKMERIMSDKELSPYRFREVNPYTIFNVKQFLKNENANIELVSTTYTKENSGILEFRCGCGNNFKRPLAMLVLKKNFCCPKCSMNKSNENKRFGIDKIKEVFEKNGLHILDTTKSYNSHDKIDCINNEGMKASVSYSRLNREENPTIAFIHKNNPFSIDNMNIILANKKAKVRIITKNEDYENNCQKLKWKCIDCGFEYERSWADFISNDSILCPKCVAKKSSSLEYKTILFLEENKIDFEMQKRFKDCVDISTLPFDFYIEKLNLIIEVDGEQHFKSYKHYREKDMDEYESLLNRQRRDKIKENYCKSKGINLLRIPFYDFRNNNYKTKILKYINTY